MYACLTVTCHLYFWQNDQDFLRATVVTRGWNGYRNKSQHRKSTLEKKIFPPFQQGFEPTTFQSRVRHSNHWAIPSPPVSEVHYIATKLIFVFPKGRPWMSDVDPPVWNLRVVIWFPFLISFVVFLPRTTVLVLVVVVVLLLFLSCHFSATGPFSWLLPENSQTFCSCCCFCVLRLVRVRLFCMALAYNHPHLPSPPPHPPFTPAPAH